MIFASKKVIFIVLIQLLVVIVNEVNSSPSPVARIDKTIVQGAKKLYSKAKDLYTKVKNAVKNLFKKLTNAIRSPKKIFNCFALSQFFERNIDAYLTDETNRTNVKFYFASSSQPKGTAVTIENSTFSFDNTDFDPYRPTVLISHGFMSNGREQWLEDMKNAFFKYNEPNVIVVDWAKGSNTYNYIKAAATTRVVGDEIAKLFDYIYDEIIRKKYDLAILGTIHFVGHSLGAHIVARGANKIKEDQSNKKRPKDWFVNRITGLDPAQPCFLWVENDKRLDENDAEFVDVIHTNARHVLLMGLGLPERIGYFDFYPNGGQMQPGCSQYKQSIWSYLFTPHKMLNATVCSHGRAYEFLTESIWEEINGKCRFTSHPWNRQYDENLEKLVQKTCANNDCPQMGINSINYYLRQQGIYFTPTGHKQPYCVVEEGDKILIENQLKYDATLIKAVQTVGLYGK